MCVVGSRKRDGRYVPGPAAARGLGRPEVDGAGGAADLQFLPQRFSRCGKPAPDSQGHLALSGPQLPRLSGGYALDVRDVLLKQRHVSASGGIPLKRNRRTGRTSQHAHPVIRIE